MLMSAHRPLGDLENPSEFIARHIGIGEQDEAHMLGVIGEASRRALIDSIVPRSIARSSAMDLPPATTEAAALAASMPVLARKLGHDLVTSSGDTLLGADDKAGIAAIMSVVGALDRRARIHPAVGATGVSVRSLELLEDSGVTPELIKAGLKVNYSGKALISQTDENGTTLAKKAIGRLISDAVEKSARAAARYLKYLHARGIANTEGRKVWVFCGDGEMDEVESLGAIGLAAREKLDNLIFVVNCNLQRLDGPVRGNGKIVQELEGEFRGSGWNVIKLLWGSEWDKLLARDKDGALRKIMMETLDGDFQAFKANDGAYVRKHFFGRDPRTLEMVSHMSDDEIWALKRGGHDPQKVYAAYHQAVNTKGQPTVLLIKTVKGFGMGKAGEGKNNVHQTKKLTDEDIKYMRDRFNIPVPDSELANVPFYKPADDTPEMQYLHERRKALGGYLPHRRTKADESFTVPSLDIFKSVMEPTAEGREISTTQAYVRFLTQLLRDQALGPRVVPILVDEARTFGMEGLFRQIGIYNPAGQQYTPVDKDQVMYYKEDVAGQILQEGINEAGGMSSWIAAATSYSTSNRIMVPFYVYYSMFGFQRIGDLAWAAGDMQARGFLLGGTSGRTTLNGEGLQHEDGHSHIMANTIPNCVSYDPTFAHEVGVILHHGLKRMVEKQDNVFYYLTLLNENYAMPGLKAGTEEQIIKGMYLLQQGEGAKKAPRVNLLGSGTILRESMAARDLLAADWGVAANVWSCPSFNELTRDGQDAERYNLLHPTETPKVPFVAQQLDPYVGPVVASTDYMKAYAEQIRPFIPKGRTYKVLGTDGFGRSDFRSKLREHFEVNRHYIVVAALKALSEEGTVPVAQVAEAIKKYGIKVDKINPLYA